MNEIVDRVKQLVEAGIAMTIDIRKDVNNEWQITVSEDTASK